MSSIWFGSKTRVLIPSVLVAVSFLLAACTGAGSTAGAPPTSTSASQAASTSPETQRSIATAIALKAAGANANPAKSPAPSGPKTVADISETAPTSGLLDSKHLAKGVGCEACHGPLPATGKPAGPSTTKCLSCHGDSYDAIATRTSSLGSRNPHKAHTGREDCDRCHRVHQPFEFSCNSCHTFPIPEKYTAGVSTQGSSEQVQTPGSGGAAYKETED